MPLTRSVPGADGGVPDIREVLSEQAALREPVETVLRLPLLSGVFGGPPEERAVSLPSALAHRDCEAVSVGILGLQECQRKLDHKLSLDSYLLKPVQRITKYQLLLKVGCPPGQPPIPPPRCRPPPPPPPLCPPHPACPPPLLPPPCPPGRQPLCATAMPTWPPPAPTMPSQPRTLPSPPLWPPPNTTVPAPPSPSEGALARRRSLWSAYYWQAIVGGPRTQTQTVGQTLPHGAHSPGVSTHTPWARLPVSSLLFSPERASQWTHGCP